MIATLTSPQLGQQETKLMEIPKGAFRIVLVENDDNDVFFLERALKKTGFTHPITRLADGQYAIEYFSHLAPENYPHAVLLDLQMPRRNGFDVLQWLRGEPAYQALPIIMLTSADEPANIQKAENLRATKFLCKKNPYKDVIDSLEQLLNQPNGRR